jgi:hypothetical protein
MSHNSPSVSRQPLHSATEGEGSGDSPSLVSGRSHMIVLAAALSPFPCVVPTAVVHVHAPVRASAALMKHDGTTREAAEEALALSLDILRVIQDPAINFLGHPNFEQLGAIGSGVFAAPSLIQGAGNGLFLTRSAVAGTVVSLYPVHGIGRMAHFESGDAAFLAADDDATFFDSVADEPAYRQYLIGSRQLLSLPSSATKGATPIFIDANPSREHTLGWQGSLVNDGAVCASSSEQDVIEYYTSSRSVKNCVLVPLGPAPLMAYALTRDMEVGEELLTTYGCEYWLAGSESTAELTPSVNALIADAASCLRDTAKMVAAKYGRDCAELQRMFSELERGGTI